MALKYEYEQVTLLIQEEPGKTWTLCFPSRSVK